MPQHHMVLPHYMGRSTELSFENKDSEQDHQKQTTVDFYSSLSPQQDIPLLLPQEAGGLPDLNIETSSPSMNHHFLNKPVEIQRSLMDSLTQYAETYGSLDEFGFLDEFGDLGHPREAAIDAPAYMKTSDDWLETEPESNHVVAVNDVKEIGPITTSNCQVSYLSCPTFTRSSHLFIINPFANNEYILTIIHNNIPNFYPIAFISESYVCKHMSAWWIYR